MMKMFFIFLIIIVFLVFSPCCFAEELSVDDYYSEQYYASGADKLSDALPDSVKQYMEKIDISDKDISWNKEISPKNIFEEILEFFKSGFKKPLISGCMIIAILLFSASSGSISVDDKVVKYVTSIGVIAAAILPAVTLISNCVSAIKSLSVFMMAFVPVYAGTLIASGKSITATGFSTIMLFAVEIISGIGSFFVIPLSGMQLSLGICGSIFNEVNISSFGKALKKIALWILSLASTVFLGVLSIQTAVASPADGLATKTTKFIVGTAIPIVGNTVSEAISTVRGCLKLLSSSVAVYAVIAVAIIFLPIILELLIWRIILLFTSSLAEIMVQDNTSKLLKNVDSVVSFILGIMILTAVLFIISISIVSVV